MVKYHMNKPERELTDPAVLSEIMRGGKYAVIGLCRGGEPYVVALSYGYDQAGHCLYFHSAPTGLKLAFLKENPEACATVIEDRGYLRNECGHRYRSVVLRGRMSVVTAEEEKRRGMEVLALQLEEDLEARLRKLRSLAGPEWDRLTILRLDIREMTGKAGQ